MPIEANTRLLHYTLTEKIGEGGMGAVWRATDTTLNRQVAIKLLPQIFADDQERLARFEREAKLLATLNHPNIATVYGLHQAEGDEGSIRFLAMELVEGQDLQRQLEGGRMSVDQVLEIAVQMAAGIEAAHEKGVVHRDLKPANVIVTPEGQVKLLDFGLAKAFDADSSGSDPSFSPTITSVGSVAGMILGTAAYMSPEQARGKPVDRRADIWSFGCVLYECLTGVRLFGGETVSDSLAAILRKDPDWSRLPDDTPSMVRLLLQRCLTRNPLRRLRDIGDARLELELAIESPEVEAPGLPSASTEAGHGRASRLRWLPWAVAAVALLGLAYVALQKDVAQRPRAERRLLIPVPGPARFASDLIAPPVISPDGRFVVFSATDETGESRLWVRPMDEFEARPLAGTEGALCAFWSPDSRHLGFFESARMRRVELATGRIQSIGADGSAYPRGGSWGPDGTILYAPNANSGIYAIDGSGGAPRQITVPDADIPDSSHRWPVFLPDGRHFLFAFWSNDVTSRREHGGIYVGSLDGEIDPVRIVSGGSSAAYAPPGYLLLVQEGNLIALPFDTDTRNVTGEAMVISERVLENRDNGYGSFSVSTEGTLVHARGESTRGAELVWYDRDGTATPPGIEPLPFLTIRLSPDASRAAAIVTDATGDLELWMVDLERGVRTAMASADWSYNNVVWSRSGDRLLYTSQEKGHSDIYIRLADGSGDQQELVIDDYDKLVYDWSGDGKFIVYWMIGVGGGTPDLQIYSIDEGASTTLIAGAPTYDDAVFSPDSRYIAYVSNESGRPEIFVHAREDGARWQLSTDGGTKPRWRDDGREIVYLDPERRLMSVSVDNGANRPVLGKPVELFTLANIAVSLDATGDHQRFLVAARSDLDSEPLHVILDWDANLQPGRSAVD